MPERDNTTVLLVLITVLTTVGYKDNNSPRIYSGEVVLCIVQVYIQVESTGVLPQI